MENTRELVLNILLEVTRENQYSHLVIREVLNKYQYLEKRERAFITRLSEGTIQRMIELDYMISQFSSVKINKMKPVIRNILRMSVYQICYMDGIPDSAACNEAVKLARKKGFSTLSGFVNGVLRNISRNKTSITYPDEKKNPVEFLSVTYSMPEWIVNQWILDYGMEQTREILETFLQEAPLTIRTNLLKCTPQELKELLEKEGVTVTPLVDVITGEEFAPLTYAFTISDYNYLNALKSFQEGLFYVQDISSMMVAEYAMPKAGDYVIDVCAAPGGKSIHIGEKIQCQKGATGKVEARDLTEHKVELIQENIDRYQLEHVSAVVMDATVPDEKSLEQADILIADLPCSGLGVLRKKSDIKYKMTREQQQELAALQREILHTVFPYVKHGGIMIYSTCTIHKGENEDNVTWFVENHPEYELLEMHQIFPQKHLGDGFFIAKLLRR